MPTETPKSETETPETTPKTETPVPAAAPKKPRARIVSVAPEDFVKAWQTGSDSKSVAETLGISESSAAGRASYMRKLGIPLKRMGGKLSPRQAMDVSTLKALANEFSPKNVANKGKDTNKDTETDDSEPATVPAPTPKPVAPKGKK